MIRYGLFEDDPFFRKLVKEQMAEHELIERAVATTLGQAFDVLKSLAAKEVTIDLLLLDGNLKQDCEPARFIHTLPLSDEEIAALAQPQPKRLFGRRAAATPQPKELIISRSDFDSPPRDAKAVAKVMELLNLDIPIIGISGDGLERTGIPLLDDVYKENIFSEKENIPSLGQVVSQHFQ